MRQYPKMRRLAPPNKAVPAFAIRNRALMYRSDDGQAVPVQVYEVPRLMAAHVVDHPELRLFYTHEELHGQPPPVSADEREMDFDHDDINLEKTWKEVSSSRYEELVPTQALERIHALRSGHDMSTYQTTSQNGLPPDFDPRDPGRVPQPQQVQPQPQQQVADPQLLALMSKMLNVMTNIESRLNRIDEEDSYDAS